MNSGVYIVVQCILIFLDVITLAMTVRMIMSWFVFDGENKFMTFLFVLTEPIILPIRALCDRFGWFQNIPLDIPFFITAVLLMLIRMFLEASMWA